MLGREQGTGGGSRLKRRVTRLVVSSERVRHEPRDGELAHLYGDPEGDRDERSEQHEEIEEIDQDVHLRRWRTGSSYRHFAKAARPLPNTNTSVEVNNIRWRGVR